MAELVDTGTGQPSGRTAAPDRLQRAIAGQVALGLAIQSAPLSSRPMRLR